MCFDASFETDISEIMQLPERSPRLFSRESRFLGTLVELYTEMIRNSYEALMNPYDAFNAVVAIGTLGGLVGTRQTGGFLSDGQIRTLINNQYIDSTKKGHNGFGTLIIHEVASGIFVDRESKGITVTVLRGAR